MPSLEAPDADDLRTYRLNLSREARRFKRYPAIARERGLEGIVVVVVSTRAGVALPQVSLSQGSGETVLDQQALEMVNFAVRYALMPNSLRQRDFGIDLPIHFSLDE
jgi:protein TonB